MKIISWILIATISPLSYAELVKQSKSGICHDSSSAWFEKTKNFTPYDSVKDCIKNGGRLPRNSKPTTKAKKDNAKFSTIYDRHSWSHWSDFDKDCQDTRQEVLIAASSTPVKFKSIKKCKVKSGSWYDPFSDKTWTDPSDLDVDHIVPLAWAHGHGGASWSKKQKKVFANDFQNLLAVEDNLNQSKSAQSPDTWMPPNQKFRCEYVSKFNEIVNKYGLEYVPSEKRTIGKMLKKCSQ
jgi:hypothetical protein